MERPDGSFATSFCKGCSAECGKLPKRTWGCPIEHAFDGRKMIACEVWLGTLLGARHAVLEEYETTGH